MEDRRPADRPAAPAWAAVLADWRRSRTRQRLRAASAFDPSPGR